MVRGIMPILENVLTNADSKVSEKACVCVCEIVESFSSHRMELAELITPDLLRKLLALLNPNVSTTHSIRSKLLKIIAILTRSLNSLAVVMIRERAGDIIYQILTQRVPLFSMDDSIRKDNSAIIQALIHCSRDLMVTSLTIISEMFPAPEPVADCKFSGPYRIERRRGQEQSTAVVDERVQELAKYPEELNHFCSSMVSLLLDIYSSSIDTSVRQKVLNSLIRIVSVLDAPSLAMVLHNVELASLISSILSQQDFPSLVVGALEVGDVVLDKIPDVYRSGFYRLGIIEQVKKICNNNQHQQQDDRMDEEDTDRYHETGSLIPLVFDSELSELVVYDASRLLASYERGNSDSQGYECEAAQMMQSLVDLVDGLKSDRDIEYQLSSLYKLVGEVSSFELVHSGALDAILWSLASSPNVASNRECFIKVFMNDEDQFELLVEKLHEALSRAEEFEVITTGDSRATPAGMLARQVRIKLLAEDGTDVPKQLRSIIISIQAIATFKAVNEFFRSKIALSRLFGGNDSGNEDDSKPQQTAGDWHLEFYMDDQEIPHDGTIVGAIYKYLEAQQSPSSSRRSFSRTIWTNTYTIHFRKVPGKSPPASRRDDIQAEDVDPFKEVPTSFGDSPVTSVAIRLLSILFELNSSAKGLVELPLQNLAETKFLNSKLTAKLNRQLEEPLVIASAILPPWMVDATRLYPFLFPFDSRYMFLQSTSFGYSRCMSRWSSEGSEERLGRLLRQKVRVSRNHILHSAVKVMNLCGASPNILEVEFFDEVGTGLGPTLEFYTSVSQEFSLRQYKMWRDSEADPKSRYAFGRLGLFPSPMDATRQQSSNGKKILQLFKTLGTFVARALLDSRIIDINLNPVLFEIARSRVTTLTRPLSMIAAVDRQLCNSLKVLEKYHAEGDMAIENLALDFTLPGYPEIELIPNGNCVAVTLDNVQEYLERVVDLTVGQGVEAQIGEFRKGFSLVFPYSALHAFTPQELAVLCGQGEEDWSYEALLEAVKADHGYTKNSRVIKDLLEVMSEFNQVERRSFLQFMTGSPNLPIGGFKAMNPVFTVVWKQNEEPFGRDDYLPSVMTCANYLKLPNYSSKEVLRRRLWTAMNEGSGAFLLS
jgi:E3 ubiquitin-protein ligase TRIP12